MNPTFNYSYENRIKIREWKKTLSPNATRLFSYVFTENGKRDDVGSKLHTFFIITNDKYKLIIEDNVTLD